MKQNLLSFLILILFAAPSFAQAAPPEQLGITDAISKLLGLDPPPRAPTQVNAKLWRSGRPTRETLTQLYARGVRVIIDLEDDQNAVNTEAVMAKKLGFKFFSSPMNSILLPSDQAMSRILEILQVSPVPVLVHCKHGQDRTGLVVGLERVFLENWPAKKAYREMLAYHFHPALVGLDLYFRMKTDDL